MGYDCERFVGKINDDLKCMICLDVLEDPQECQVCQTSFCSSCILAWAAKKKTCPNNCELKLQRSHKFLRSELDKLLIYCINKDFGCEDVIKLENLSMHETNCEFSTVDCKYSCGFKSQKKDIIKHETFCEFREVECANCKSFYQIVKQTDHNCLQVIGQKLKKFDLKLTTYVDECYFFNHLFNDIVLIHFGFKCSTCGMDPIEGQRYFCLTCKDFSECWRCNSSKSHEHSNFAVFTKYGVHENVLCDECGTYPISSLRYKCKLCDNFDLCHSCMQNQNHQHKEFVCWSPTILSAVPLPIQKNSYKVGEQIIRGWKIFNEGEEDFLDFCLVCIKGESCTNSPFYRMDGKVIKPKSEREIWIKDIVTQNVPGYYKSVWGFERNQRAGIFGPFLTIELVVMA